MASDKLERLMNLVAALLHTSQPLSAADLQMRVGGYSTDEAAFRRQFSRDKQDLREMGVPILVVPVPGTDPPATGYRIDPDDYYLPDPRLDTDELGALHLATRLVAVDADSAPAGLFKLGGLVAGAPRDAAPWVSMVPEPALGTMFDAIHRRRVVDFDYHGRARRLVPHALAFRNGRWYVTGHDLEIDDERVYRLDRIEGQVRAGEAAPESPKGPDELGSLQPWQVGGTEARTAKLRVDPVAVPTVTAQIGQGAAVTLDDDGSAEVTLEVTSPDGFRIWILGLGPAVEVTEPVEFRDDITTWLDRIIEGAS
jgi:predicted DNA-binding transcriptional regulator YafY